MGLVVFAIVVPIYWMVICSLSLPRDIYTRPPNWIPSPLTLEHYRALFAEGWERELLRTIPNSAVVAFSNAALSLILGGVAAYALAKIRPKGRLFLLFAILGIQLIPYIVFAIPLYLILSSLNLLDRLDSLSLIYCSFTLPIAIWLMYNYFQMIPSELIDAALIDGCSHLRALVRIVVPISTPALIATAVICFIGAWNDFLFALILTSSVSARTAPVTLAGFIGKYRVGFTGMSAASLLVSIPPVLLAVTFRKFMVRGLTMGAIK